MRGNVFSGLRIEPPLGKDIILWNGGGKYPRISFLHGGAEGGDVIDTGMQNVTI
jgi:hypothetical protein